MRFFLAALAVALTAATAQAQQLPGQNIDAASRLGAHASQHGNTDTVKVKANDKAYDAALRNLPDKAYDPWHGIR
jgi:hypothetical protein